MNIKNLFLLLIFFASPSVAAVSVQLTVQEVLPSGVTGLERTNEIVTSGIPLADSDGIADTSTLGLTGPSAGQFRIIGRYPSGNAKWVLVDFPTSVTAGGTTSATLTDSGSGDFGGNDLATDGTTISIDTGAATFTVKKTGFNILDTAIVGVDTIVSTGNSGAIEAVGTDTTLYSSANDTATVTLEENGPVRAVVKATGSLKSAGAVRLMDYTLRLHFFKGKSQVKTQLVLRNAYVDAKQDIKFKSVSLNIPTALTGTKTVSFARASDVVSDDLGSSETAYLYQGWNSHTATALTTVTCYYWIPPIPGTCDGAGAFSKNASYYGLDIKSGATVLNTVGTSTDYSRGYADISDSVGKGVSVASQWLESNWGSGIEFTDAGVVTVEPYSKNNGNIDVTMLFAKYETRAYMLNFHTAANSGQAELYALQYPLVARASLDHYAAAGAFFGQTELADTAEEIALFNDYNETQPTFSNPAFSPIYKEWQWSKPGSDNQINFPLADLVDFVRTGYGGYYLKGWQRTDFNLDTASYKSDGFEGFGSNETISPSYLTVGNSQRGIADAEHAHFSSSPIWYYMSGDENTKDRYLETGEWVQRNNDLGYYAVPGTQFFRAWSLQIKNIAQSYEFTCQTDSCNSTLYNTLATATNYILDSRENPSSVSTYGRSMERGYTYWETITNIKDCSGVNRTGVRAIHSLYIAPIHFESMYNVYRVLSDTAYTRKLDLHDYLTGLAQFLLDDYITITDENSYFYGTPLDFTRAFEYNMLLDESIAECSAPYTQPYYRTYNIGRAANWIYKQTGDASYITAGEILLWESTQEGTPRETADLSGQSILFMRKNYKDTPVWKYLPITSVDNGGGSYTLSWTVPVGASGYQIKYSNKQIIDSLGFDKVTRTYQYPPSTYTPYFAANNIANNPEPATPGETQEVTVTGLGTGVSFAVKYTGTKAQRTSSSIFSTVDGKFKLSN